MLFPLRPAGIAPEGEPTPRKVQVNEPLPDDLRVLYTIATLIVQASRPAGGGVGELVIKLSQDLIRLTKSYKYRNAGEVNTAEVRANRPK